MNFHMITERKDLILKIANYHFTKPYMTTGDPDHLLCLVKKTFDFVHGDRFVKDLNMYLLASRTVYDAEHGEAIEQVEAFRYLRDKAREAIVNDLFANEMSEKFKRDAMSTIETFLKTLWLPKEEEKDEEEDEKLVTFTFEATLVPEKQ